MMAPTAAKDATTSVPVKPPLGLPAGSVRATLAVILSATLWTSILRGQAPEPILVDSALLVVAFYFGVRSTAPLVPAAAPAPAPEAPKVRQPLYLPRGWVRAILAGGFLVVIGYVVIRDGTMPQALVLILQVIVSYAIGWGISRVLLRRARLGKELGRGARVARNAMSVAAIGVTAGASWAILAGQFDLVPEYLRNGLAWTIAFYFGSRLGP